MAQITYSIDVSPDIIGIIDASATLLVYIYHGADINVLPNNAIPINLAFYESGNVTDQASITAAIPAMEADLLAQMNTYLAPPQIIDDLSIEITYDDITYQWTFKLDITMDEAIIARPLYCNFIVSGSNAIDITSAFLFDIDTPPADLTICTECRQSNQQACGETYFIEAGLTSGDTYYAAITDRNNDVYIQAIIADANGDLTIDATAPEFPVGFWLAESGNKSITVYEDEEMTIVSELTVGANVYTCMILSLQYIYVTTTSLTPDFSFYVSDTLEYYVDQSSNSYISS